MCVGEVLRQCGHAGGPGTGASPEGNRPFMDLLDVDSGETQRLWQSQPPYLETPGSLLSDLGDQPIM